jgi:hypothetical protein
MNDEWKGRRKNEDKGGAEKRFRNRKLLERGGAAGAFLAAL